MGSAWNIVKEERGQIWWNLALKRGFTIIWIWKDQLSGYGCPWKDCYPQRPQEEGPHRAIGVYMGGVGTQRSTSVHLEAEGRGKCGWSLHCRFCEVTFFLIPPPPLRVPFRNVPVPNIQWEKGSLSSILPPCWPSVFLRHLSIPSRCMTIAQFLGQFLPAPDFCHRPSFPGFLSIKK